MARKRYSISQREANAYKTKAEGTAILVKEWMPLMKLVTLSVTFLIARYIGIDLQVLYELLALFKP